MNYEILDLPDDDRAAVAAETDDRQLLEALATDRCDSVREATAGNVLTPFDALAKLTQDPDPLTREAAASNPCAPLQYLEPLLLDRDRDVRNAALKRLGANHPLAAEAAKLDAAARAKAAKRKALPDGFDLEDLDLD